MIRRIPEWRTNIFTRRSVRSEARAASANEEIAERRAPKRPSTRDHDTVLPTQGSCVKPTDRPFRFAFPIRVIHSFINVHCLGLRSLAMSGSRAGFSNDFRSRETPEVSPAKPGDFHKLQV